MSHIGGLATWAIWHLGTITGCFSLGKRLARVSGLQPKGEHCLMGRAPRTKF